MRILKYCWIVWLIGVSNSAWSDVVLNEIMYHKTGSELEYIELFNTSDEVVSVGGWQLSDDDDSHFYIIPTNLQIETQGYMVIANDLALFREEFGFKADAGGFSFNFGNAGDQVRLYDTNLNLIEMVHYDDRLPWSELADGHGSSLERRNPRLPAPPAQAWDASTNSGTPGERNSVYTDQLDPLILEIDHSPKIPEPGQPVHVSARVFDVDGELSTVRLYFGVDNERRYRPLPMYDDGEHGDGEAGDGVFGAEIPGMSLGDILGFYIEARDDEGNESRVPEGAEDEPYLTVVENPVTNENVSMQRFVMRPDVYQDFLNRFRSDEYFPATYYDDERVHYRVDVRHRGRSRIRNGRFKVRFPHSDLFRDRIRRLNFNGTNSSTILREYLSFQLYEDAGLPNMETFLARLHVNGGPADGTPYRIAIENPDSQYLNRQDDFQNDDGNLYKTTLDGTPENKATWRYVGDDPDLYNGSYIKQTNEAENDYSDIIEFCRVLNASDTWDADYLDNVYSVMNADNFLKWMAVSACVAHWDSPYTDHGHNYVMYNNPATEQFYTIAWDLNNTFQYSSNHNDLNYRKHYTHIRSTKFPAVNKILNHPVLGAQYYREIAGMLNYLFSKPRMYDKIEEARQALKLSSGSVSFLRTFVNQRVDDLSEWINQDQGMAFLTHPNNQVVINEPYTYRISVVDYQNFNRPTLKLAEGPDWLTLDEEKHLLSGTPDEAGVYTVVLEAENSIGIDIEQEFEIQVVDPHPRLIMNFNEEGDTVIDQGPYQNHGQLRSSARRVSGRLGQAIMLRSNSDRVEIPHDESLNLSGSVTVEAWINPDSMSVNNPVILSKGDANRFNYKLMLGYGPFNAHPMEPCFMPHPFDIINRVYYGEKEIEANLRPREWVHVAGTFDAQRELTNVYYNGKHIVNSAARTHMVPNTEDLLIGLNDRQSFQGQIDDLKILPYAKQAFAAGLCLNRVDVSGISPAQDRVSLVLSSLRDESVNTGDYCLYVNSLGAWLPLPDGELEAGESRTFWMDDLGLQEALPSNVTLGLYPKSAIGQPDHEWVLDQVVWGSNAPDALDPGVRAAVWLPGRSLKLNDEVAQTLSLINFADNDDMDRDWQVQPQQLDGPRMRLVEINDGEIVTNGPAVRLKVLPGRDEPGLMMRVSNRPAMDAEWRPYTEDLSWTLTEGDGNKTVYVQLMDAQGRRSAVEFDEIELNSIVGINDWRVR